MEDHRSMLLGLYIIVDDDYGSPLYADPAPAELEDGVWTTVCEVVQDVFDDERESRGALASGEVLIGWRGLVKSGITFVAVARDIRAPQLDAYLSRLARRYADEVDDPRSPERGGVEDVVVDVIPPWEEEQD
jgi:hypothetical protein